MPLKYSVIIFFIFLTSCHPGSATNKPKSTADKTFFSSPEAAYKHANYLKSKSKTDYLKYYEYACSKHYIPACYALMGEWNTFLEETQYSYTKDQKLKIKNQLLKKSFSFCKEDISPMCAFTAQLARKTYMNNDYSVYYLHYLFSRYLKKCEQNDIKSCIALRELVPLNTQLKKLIKNLTKRKYVNSDKNTGNLIKLHNQLPPVLKEAYYYKTGCTHGDLKSCEYIGYLYYLNRRYNDALTIFKKTCFKHQKFCTYIPFIFKSIFLKRYSDYKKMRPLLQKLCDKTNNVKSCIYAAEGDIYGWWNDANTQRGIQDTKRMCIKSSRNSAYLPACKLLLNVYIEQKKSDMIIQFYKKLCSLNQKKYCMKLADFYLKKNRKTGLDFLYNRCVPESMRQTVPKIRAINSIRYYRIKELKAPACGKIADFSIKKGNSPLNQIMAERILSNICKKSPEYSFCFRGKLHITYLLKECDNMNYEACSEYVKIVKSMKKSKRRHYSVKHAKEVICLLRPKLPNCQKTK